jgi:hypothetical protein
VGDHRHHLNRLHHRGLTAVSRLPPYVEHYFFPEVPVISDINARQQLWEWYHSNKEMPIVTLFGFYIIRVKQLKKLFEQLAGYDRTTL